MRSSRRSQARSMSLRLTTQGTGRRVSRVRTSPVMGSCISRMRATKIRKGSSSLGNLSGLIRSISTRITKTLMSLSTIFAEIMPIR